MTTFTMRYAHFIDELRIKRKMKVKELCEGICSDRSYRRYVSGERTLPHEKIVEFCLRLRLSPDDFYYMYQNQKENDMNIFTEMYEALAYRDFDRYLKLEKKIKNRKHNYFNTRFYEYLQVWYQIQNKMLTDQEGIVRYSKIIDFPNMMENDVYDYVDLITLLSLSQLQTRSKNQSFEAIELLERILRDDSILYMTFGSRHTLLTVISAVAVGYFRKQDYDKAMALCDEGIAKCKKAGLVYPLGNMYYVRACIYYENNDRTKALLEVHKCLASVLAIENTNLYRHYLNLATKRFDTTIEEINETFLKHVATT